MITTRYHGPTNFRGARVSARGYGGRKVTLSWDHALDISDNHDIAARALAAKLDLRGHWLRMSAPDHTPDAYCYIRDTAPFAFEVR